MTEEYKKRLAVLTTEEKTLYAVQCVELFCKNKGISHPYIDDFLEHMESIQACITLEQWLNDEEKLPFWGDMGENPAEIDALVPEDSRKEFYKMVSNARWVGGCDICGASSDMPMKTL